MSAFRRLLVLSVLCVGPLTSLVVAEGASAAPVRAEAAVVPSNAGENPDDLTWGG